MVDFTILITTFNRCADLLITLHAFAKAYPEVPIIICDDASTDETIKSVRENFPIIEIVQNKTNKGLIHNRNVLFSKVKTPYALSIDDDANFLTGNSFENILSYFEEHPKCAVLALRLYWGLERPETITTHQKPHQVDSFPGGAHALRMRAWREIPEYPAWYKFYGEEQFASLQFFKKGWEVHYLPQVLVHHRVDNKARKKNKDYVRRTRRALHASWSNILIFFPLYTLPRKLMYSVYAQLRLKVFKGDFRAGLGLLGAIIQVLVNLPKLINKRNTLTRSEYLAYRELPPVLIYWNPKNK